MSNTARKLLEKLLAQVDRGGRETLLITERAAKAYFENNSLSERDSVHAYLANAEASGAIFLEWGKGAAAQDLKRIRISDANKLAELLDVPRAIKHANRIESILAPVMVEAPTWLSSSYEQAIQKWKLGKPAFRVKAEETDTAGNLFRIALAVASNKQADLDLRRFSVQLLNNSKAVENLLGKVAPLLRSNPEWEQFKDNNELFRALGLEKFPPPVYVKGPLVFQYSNEQLDITDRLPFVGVSPDRVTDLATTLDAPYLLTIENLASFQRHVREIEDSGIVIYSAGFPSPALSHIFNSLDSCLPTSCPCFHWGDRDVGGIRIFSHIEKAFPKHKLLPHQMLDGYESKQKFDSGADKQLKVYADLASEAGSMARHWIDNKLGPLEQEAQDPASPV